MSHSSSGASLGVQGREGQDSLGLQAGGTGQGPESSATCQDGKEDILPIPIYCLPAQLCGSLAEGQDLAVLRRVAPGRGPAWEE